MRNENFVEQVASYIWVAIFSFFQFWVDLAGTSRVDPSSILHKYVMFPRCADRETWKKKKK